jgi:hypothetical protein
MYPPKGTDEYNQLCEKHRQISLNLLKNPEYVRKRLDGLRKAGSTPEFKEKMRLITKNRVLSKEATYNKKVNCSNAAKKQWANIILRNRIMDSICIARSKPEFSKKLSAAIIKTFVDKSWYGSVVYYDKKDYCEKFNDNLKERVRAYWDYKCFECGTPQNKTKLHVHHVHYDKQTCCNGSPHDLIPLCHSCHAKTNFNRDYWEDHFTDLLYMYSIDGKCFFTLEEMQLYRGMIPK